MGSSTTRLTGRLPFGTATVSLATADGSHHDDGTTTTLTIREIINPPFTFSPALPSDGRYIVDDDRHIMLGADIGEFQNTEAIQVYYNGQLLQKGGASISYVDRQTLTFRIVLYRNDVVTIHALQP